MSIADVIVVGAGGSGLAAGVSAAEDGLSVLVLERRPQPGGTTGIAIGSFTAAGTALQRSAGIVDAVADHAHDAGLFAAPEIEARNNAPLRRFFLAHAADTHAWLLKLGLRFHGPSPEPPNRVPRMHNVVPSARAYVLTLQARLLRLGGRLCCGVDVVGLVREGGRVVGVRARADGAEQELRARRGVVLAAGDYASAPEMIARYRGERFASIEGINPHAGGAGHRLAEEAGARMLNMDVTYGPELRFVPPPRRGLLARLPASGPLARLMGWLLPVTPRFVVNAVVRRLLVAWQHPENALLDDGALLVNRLGRRFCDERASPEREIAVSRQPDRIAYLLLDEWLAERYGRWPHFVSTAPKIAYAYVGDYLKLRPDVAVAGTLEEVAGRRGIPAEALRQTVAEHNASASRPLAGARWVLLGPARAYITTTEGGAAIDEQLRVLDVEGRPIPGLYAVGQVGLGGMILWGHGLHIAWALTSGRLVGKVLADTGSPGQHDGK